MIISVVILRLACQLNFKIGDFVTKGPGKETFRLFFHTFLFLYETNGITRLEQQKP
jgi:hypothetical protein